MEKKYMIDFKKSLEKTVKWTLNNLEWLDE